jgi:F-type H+-transporting ATPase subunit b
MELLKLLNANEVIVQVLTFLILFFLLRRFFWKKFLKVLDDRKERISSEFKNIETQKAQIEDMHNEYLKKIKAIEDSQKARIQEAIKEGQRLTEELKKKAEDGSARIVENARNEARSEFAKAKEALKGEVTDLVLDATTRLLEEKVSAEKDKQFVREFIDELDKVR